jgi:tRNA threonylcarbamoyladenosine biosynthesis protein TsaE
MKAYERELLLPEDTESLGELLGRQLRGGEVIELIGDVGAGKTTMVRGIAKGIGSQNHVSSPTFTISQVYTSEGITLHHYDFYRLTDLKIISEELKEVMSEPGHSVVMEWAGSVSDSLPMEHVTIKLIPDADDVRSAIISVPDEFGYIEMHT